MSALIVIPARLGSSRLPLKPLRELGGRPLVVRVLERVQSLQTGCEIVVATDDEQVARVVRAAGGTAVLTSSDHVSGTDRVAEVAQHPDYSGHDVVVNVQGDEPFVSGEAIAAARGQVEVAEMPLGTAACGDDPAVLAITSVVKVVCDRQGRALYFTRAPVPFLRDVKQTARRDALILRHIGIYAYRRAALLRWVALPPADLELVEQLEQLRPLVDGIPIGVGIVTGPLASGIDTEDDLAKANAAWPEPAYPAPSPVPAGTR